MLKIPPLALYIHIPWCEKKCPYCDFNSHVSQQIPEAAYIDALLRDADGEQALVQGRAISSIFIGGGTPSLFSGAGITRLMRGLEQRFRFADDIEITMEANPSSAEQKTFKALYQEAGINRLSIGVQSFCDEQLMALGRVHNAGEARAAITAAQQAGFQRINLDLMHGLPRQTPEKALNDLQTAIDSGVSHISWYQLTIEKNTAFYRQPPALPEEDTLASIQDLGADLLSQHGFQQYEVSAFCQGAQQARHNLNYWRFGDYLAIGAGAHGKITLPETGQIMRYHKTRLPKDYLARDKDFLAQQSLLDEQQRLFEFLMNGLRLPDGVSLASFIDYTDLSPNTLQQHCQSLIEQKLLSIDSQIKTTPLGFRFLNSVLERLI